MPYLSSLSSPDIVCFLSCHISIDAAQVDVAPLGGAEGVQGQ